MTAERIRKHFEKLLGPDVKVSFVDNDSPRAVILHRADRLSDGFVTWAFEQLARTAPELASRIDRLLVSYESRLGPMRRGVDLPLSSRQPHPSASAANR
jgi:hypothetical protein